MTKIIAANPAFVIVPIMMIISGSPGITKKIFVNIDKISSPQPDKKPADTPMTAANTVAIRPVDKLTTITPLVPIMICEKIS